MNLNDMGAPDLRTLATAVRFSLAVVGARVLSILALCGFFALCFYALYSPVQWIGAVVCGIAALVFIVAVRAESVRQAPTGGPDGQV